MDDALGMTMLKSFEEIHHDCCCLYFGKRFLPGRNFLEELASRAQLHAEVDVLLIVVRLVILDYIWMVDLLHELDLTLQTLEILRVEFRLIDNLDGHDHGLILLITSSEHFPVRSRTENFLVDIIGFLQIVECCHTLNELFLSHVIMAILGFKAVSHFIFKY